ncbi:MAG: cytochrome C oxidase subunit IV family protein [Acidobacteriota bacterium]
MEALHGSHSNRLYLTVWSGLVVLTIAEVILAYIALSAGLMLTLLISFSLIKTALIVAYFMHLRFEKLSLTLTLIPALVICIILMFIVFPDSLRLLELRR